MSENVRTVYRVSINLPSNGGNFVIETFDRSEADVWLARMMYHLRELLTGEPVYLRQMEVRWNETEWRS